METKTEPRRIGIPYKERFRTCSKCGGSKNSHLWVCDDCWGKYYMGRANMDNKIVPYLDRLVEFWRFMKR